MPVMQVGKVRVPVDQRRMGVYMRMRFARRIVRRMRMLMVFVMHMAMAVRDGIVRVFVLVPFGQMQPDADGHQGGGQY